MNTDHRKFTIGRDPHSDISIADETVSSSHATLSFLGDEILTITDSDSRNGTYHLEPDGRETRIHHAQVSTADKLRFGMVVLDVRQIVDTIHFKHPQLFDPEPLKPDPSPNPSPTPTPSPSPSPALIYAGFWKRALATVIDSAILFSSQIFIAIVGMYNGVELAAAFIFTLFVAAPLGWLYSALMESSAKQGTLGKMILGIQVTDLAGRRIGFGRATGRFFGRYLSGALLMIGFFMVAFTEKKQALHDMMAGCLVVNARQ